MKRVLRWAGRGILVVAGLLVVAVGVVYAVSSRKMAARYDLPLDESIAFPSDSAAIVEGERLARIYGCYAGCHGSGAEGQLFMDEFLMGTIKAPDLTRAVRSMSDAELERVIRHGIRVDGDPVYVMPSASFFDLTDEHLGAIVAFLRSLPESDGPETSVRFGPVPRMMFVLDHIEPAAATLDHDAPRLEPGDGSDPEALGRYLARTACSECHGRDLAGGSNPVFTTPNLAIVASYSAEQFRTLMREGVPRGDVELGIMAAVAQKRFAHLTDAEIDGLYAYLTDM